MRSTRDKDAETQRRFEHTESTIASTRHELFSLWEIVMKQQREIEVLKRKVNGVTTNRTDRRVDQTMCEPLQR